MIQEEYWKNYPWYEIVEGDDIEQGDFIDGCKVIIPRYTLTDLAEETASPNTLSHQVDGDVDTYNVIIISQSCDLDKMKVDYVLVCPRWPYSQVVKDNPKFGTKDAFERVKKGIEYRYCMLGQGDLPDLPPEVQIVDFNKVFSIPCDIMKQIALSNGKRLRLRSPYKERLAQAFAYFHMRVALPNGLPSHAEAKALMQVSTTSTAL